MYFKIFLALITILLSGCNSSNYGPKKLGLHPEEKFYEEVERKGERGKYNLNGNLRSQIYIDRTTGRNWTEPGDLIPSYSKGFNPNKKASLNRNLPDDNVYFAKDAFTRFNDQDAAYQIAFHLSHYGGMPEDLGDINNDGINDFGNMSHFAYSNNKMYAGECHIWLGRKEKINTKKDFPDLIVYGDKAYGKICISFAAAGDFNGDGIDDFMMSAAFRDSEREGEFLEQTGSVYIVYGGQFKFEKGKTIQIRAEDIGSKVKGIHIGAENDGSAYLGYANGLESGDINGDGISDLVISSYNPYESETRIPHFAPRAYIIFGSKHKAKPYGKIWLDDKNPKPLDISKIVMPKDVGRCSLCLGVSIVGDINNDGKDEIGIGLGYDGKDKMGEARIFYGKNFPKILKLNDSDVTITASTKAFTKRVAKESKLVNKEQRIWAQRIEQIRPVKDFNCDGNNDILVTARSSVQNLEGKPERTGGAAIFFGSNEKLSSQLNIGDADVWIGNSQKSLIGQPAIDRHFDMNGDGCSEIAINDPYYLEEIGNNMQYRGRVWILKGSKNPKDIYLIEDDAAATFVADTKYPGMFGYTWQMGDWNGDGKIDLVVGDHYHGDDYLNIHRGVTFMFYNGYDFKID